MSRLKDVIDKEFLGNSEKAAEVTRELLEAVADAVEEKEPGAVNSITTMRDAADEVMDLEHYL